MAAMNYAQMEDARQRQYLYRMLTDKIPQLNMKSKVEFTPRGYRSLTLPIAGRASNGNMVMAFR